ncbi:unnamed protein product [Paramecium octaurelia]|uniref:Uncharacterized protein n=1 Tax=Paramecium octaurelia TaxID=43137 RepID=A0A8S1V0B9_PAROT|nr:unnamed protein product [Paramecium octaurelia]
MKFNSTSSMLFIGHDKGIKIHAFQNGCLHKICQFYHSKNGLINLNCKKDTNLFSCCEKMIKMRSLFGVNNQKIQMKIHANNNLFTCFAICEKKNLIVAGLEKLIYFWEESGQCVVKLDLKEIDEIDDWVFSLRFNESQNKLITCYGNNTIAIIQQQNNNIQSWKIIQLIVLNNFGAQAYFFGDDIFVVHPWMSKTMQVYKFCEENYLFKLSNSFLLEGEGQQCNSFQTIYIKQRRLFIKQDKNILCLFLIDKNQEFQVFQKVKFEGNFIFGTISDDGQWLIIWEEFSKQMEVISFCFLK